MSHIAIEPDHGTLRNYLLQHRLPLYYSKPVLDHIMTYMTAANSEGFRGKVVDLVEYSECHSTYYSKRWRIDSFGKSFYSPMDIASLDPFILHDRTR
ncbi:hypothetical protein GCM10010912_65860 [Paenibacillus albidus]|uniref:Uncharacterized protein n=1 Tax=Paenibacillus albidus TaxID=2041023 RepID=A0A917FXU2_9BACL|nr:hypothetical protein [Paenibacillus albidus]GGG12257.1 hypothetical protein GCM10010912_65860 [Paenibacillus albidus]